MHENCPHRTLQTDLTNPARRCSAASAAGCTKSSTRRRATWLHSLGLGVLATACNRLHASWHCVTSRKDSTAKMDSKHASGRSNTHRLGAAGWERVITISIAEAAEHPAKTQGRPGNGRACLGGGDGRAGGA